MAGAVTGVGAEHGDGTGSAVGGSAPGVLAGPGQRWFSRMARRQRPGHWIATAVVVLVAVVLIRSMARNPGFGWGRVGHYLFADSIMQGLLKTIELTLIGTAIGFIGGVILALMRLSGAPLLAAVGRLYVWFFRGTPLLVQLIFWFNLGALYRYFTVGIPFGGPVWWRADVNSLITPTVAAILGLGLNAAAYMSEIIRAGMQSIHHGQIEAAQALGLSHGRTLRYVLLPQAMRVIVPPASNEVISMLKYSSMVSVIAVPELLYSAQLIYSRNFQTIPLLIVVSIWYLVLTTVLTIGQHYLEQHFGRGVKSGFARRDAVRTGSGGTDPAAGAASVLAGNGELA